MDGSSLVSFSRKSSDLREAWDRLVLDNRGYSRGCIISEVVKYFEMLVGRNEELNLF